MKKLTKVYDREIAPILLELCKKCESLGMPFVAVCQYANKATGLTAFVPLSSDPVMRLTNYAAQSKGNADALIMNMIADAKKYGSNSMFLNDIIAKEHT